MTELSVLIVTYNSAGTIQSCLESLHAFSAGIDLEVLLWDNASADATVQKAREAFPRVRIYESPENLGFGRGHNQLLERAKGKFILILNPDTYLKPNCVSRLLEFLKSHPETGAVGPKLTYPDGRFQ